MNLTFEMENKIRFVNKIEFVRPIAFKTMEHSSGLNATVFGIYADTEHSVCLHAERVFTLNAERMVSVMTNIAVSVS